MNYTKENYYTEINYDEFCNFRDNKWIDFNKRDINRLIDLSSKLKIFKWNNKDYIITGNITIRECENEWFLVCFPDNGFYKCDQYDGLLYCLKDIHII